MVREEEEEERERRKERNPWWWGLNPQSKASTLHFWTFLSLGIIIGWAGQARAR